MKKILSLIGLIFFLAGCGSEESLNISTDTTRNPTNINNKYFNLTLDSNWKILENNSETFFSAQNQDANFLIQIIEPKTKKPINEILNKVKNQFFQWKLIEKPENNLWSFSGKIEVILPTRKFFQKLIKIPETNRYFLGSCSFEVLNDDRTEVCKNILSSWELKNLE